MSIKPNLANGIAPLWQAVDDGAGFVTPEGEEAIGFFVGGAGDVSFKSLSTDTFITVPVTEGTFFTGRIAVIGDTNDGTTATDLLIATTG